MATIERENLSDIQIDRIIEMAWEDRTPFDAIKFQFGLNEADVKALMKKELKFSSYKLWRERVENCKTKHVAKRVEGIDRFKCNMQRAISNNKISKRTKNNEICFLHLELHESY
ncbi:MAG: TIGR03643 family protein [Flavobacteriaceae bacterium]|nr:TIGR03643 family protein [Flavobacteriaceae bacterium]